MGAPTPELERVVAQVWRLLFLHARLKRERAPIDPSLDEAILRLGDALDHAMGTGPHHTDKDP